jgi:hypothetical protein
MTAIALVTRRRDGKLYPVDGQLPAAGREPAIALAHAMKCEHGLSYRQVVAGLAEYGLRVSVGSVHAWIRGYRCALCRGNVTGITRDGPDDPAYGKNTEAVNGPLLLTS